MKGESFYLPVERDFYILRSESKRFIFTALID